MSGEVRELVYLLARLERLNDEALGAVCRRHGVSAAEFRVLAVLSHGGAGQALRPTEISRWIVQTTGGLTSTLGRLERSGRVRRVPDPADGRVLLVEATPEGESFHSRLLADVEARYAAVLADVDTHGMAEVLSALVAAFERRGGHAISGADLRRVLADGPSAAPTSWPAPGSRPDVVDQQV